MRGVNRQDLASVQFGGSEERGDHYLHVKTAEKITGIENWQTATTESPRKWFAKVGKSKGAFINDVRRFSRFLDPPPSA